MENKTNRLYFIDAMRAWAILMMLQGHFVDGLLDPIFRDNNNIVFNVWKYFRGITAPVFFTVSGFIFTYLLIRDPKKGIENPRVKKGIKRGLELLFIGYLLRTNFLGLIQGKIYDSFYLVDVLHCIGLSILGIIGIYLFTVHRKKYLLPLCLVSCTFLLFMFEPIYKQFNYSLVNEIIANYFTKANGSVFNIFPWFGYAAFGSFISILFTRFKNFKYLYPSAIGISIVAGFGLILYSSDLFLWISQVTDIQLFKNIYFNNYLFIRLGDVFIVFAIFMTFRGLLKNSTLLKIGQSTLSIYIVHFIILYGSFTGLGLYGFFNHSLSPYLVIPGALTFMIASTYAALRYEQNKPEIKIRITQAQTIVWQKTEPYLQFGLEILKSLVNRVLRVLGLVKN